MIAAVLVAVAFLVPPAGSPTPQGAALKAVTADGVVIERVNVAGPYATVKLRAVGLDEPVRGPILVKRYSFGWQALEVLNFSCRLRVHEISTAREAQLMRGMPKPSAYGDCARPTTDSGAPGDIEAIRRLAVGPLLPAVVVRSDYAVMAWYGQGIGREVFRKSGGSWILIYHAVTWLTASEMRAHGVPQRYDCDFGVIHANCLR